MSDNEILTYLQDRNYEVNAQDCIMDIFNTSCQIKERIFNIEDLTMTIVTDKNKFVFKLKLNKII